jgi:hypothetical protein
MSISLSKSRSRPNFGGMIYFALTATLAAYFAAKKQPDQTSAILDTLQKARTVKTVDHLKKTTKVRS